MTKVTPTVPLPARSNGRAFRTSERLGFIARAMTIGLAVGLIGGSAPRAQADDLGETMAQVDYNPRGQVLEMAIRADPAQLEQALSSYFGETVSLRKGPEDGPEALELLERRMTRYLRDTLLVTAPDSRSLSPTWIGWEMESHRRVWLYVEWKLPILDPEPKSAPITENPQARRLDGLVISQRMFFEMKAPQANLVRLRVGDYQTAMICTRERPEFTFKAPTGSESTENK